MAVAREEWKTPQVESKGALIHGSNVGRNAVRRATETLSRFGETLELVGSNIRNKYDSDYLMAQTFSLNNFESEALSEHPTNPDEAVSSFRTKMSVITDKISRENPRVSDVFKRLIEEKAEGLHRTVHGIRINKDLKDAEELASIQENKARGNITAQIGKHESVLVGIEKELTNIQHLFHRNKIKYESGDIGKNEYDLKELENGVWLSQIILLQQINNKKKEFDIKHGPYVGYEKSREYTHKLLKKYVTSDKPKEFITSLLNEDFDKHKHLVNKSKHKTYLDIIDEVSNVTNHKGIDQKGKNSLADAVWNYFEEQHKDETEKRRVDKINADAAISVAHEEYLKNKSRYFMPDSDRRTKVLEIGKKLNANVHSVTHAKNTTIHDSLLKVGQRKKEILNDLEIEDKYIKYSNAFNFRNVSLKNNPYSRAIISGALAHHGINIDNFTEFLMTDMQDLDKRKIFLDHIDRLGVLPDFYLDEVMPSMFVNQQDLDKKLWMANAKLAAEVFSRNPHMIHNIPDGQLNAGDKLRLNSILPILQYSVTPEGIKRGAMEYAFDNLYGKDARKYTEKDFQKIEKAKDNISSDNLTSLLENLDKINSDLSWYQKNDPKFLTLENVAVIPPIIKGINKLADRNNTPINKARLLGSIRYNNPKIFEQFGKDSRIPKLAGTRGLRSIKFPTENVNKLKKIIAGLPEVQSLLLADQKWDVIMDSAVVQEQMWGALFYFGATVTVEEQASKESLAKVAREIGKGPRQVKLAKKKDYELIVPWLKRDTLIGRMFDQETGPAPGEILGFKKDANLVWTFNAISQAERKEHPTGEIGWAKKDVIFSWALYNFAKTKREWDTLGDLYEYANALRLQDGLNRDEIAPGYTKESMEEEIKKSNLQEAMANIDWNTVYKGNNPEHPMFPFKMYADDNIRFEHTPEGGWRPYYLDDNYIEQPIPMWEGGGVASENYYPDWDNSIENQENIFYAEGMQNINKRMTIAEERFGDAYDIFNKDNNLTNLNVRMKKIITDLYVFWAKQRDQKKREFFQTPIPGLVKDWANSIGIRHGFDKVYKDIFSKEDWKYFDPNTPEFMNLPDARK